MKYNPDIHHQRSVRLKGYDYSQMGAYFVTICTKDREYSFGEINDGKMVMNEAGQTIQAVWDGIVSHYAGVKTDAFVVMPNHVHGIIVTANNEHLNGNENNNGRGLIYQTQNKMQTHDRIQTQKGSVSNQGLINQTPTKWILMQNSKQTLGKIVRYLKARTSKLVHDGGDSHFQWQRNYYEHVIRNEEDMNRIREYIETNPARWEEDNENPKRRGDSIINVGARHAVPPPHEQTEQFCRPVAEDGENRSPFLGWDQGSIHGR